MPLIGNKRELYAGNNLHAKYQKQRKPLEKVIIEKIVTTRLSRF